MPRYVIESEMPGVGRLSAAELRAAVEHSVCVLNEMGPNIQWLQSFVTADKIYAVYTAPDKKTIFEYARQVGLSADRVSEVTMMLEPKIAEG